MIIMFVQSDKYNPKGLLKNRSVSLALESILCSPRKKMYNLKYFYNFKYVFHVVLCFKLQFISVIKAVFSASLLQSSVSHDPSEISLIC